MKLHYNFFSLLFVMILAVLPASLNAQQCPAGQTYNTYCYGQGEVNNVAFEFCPTTGDIAQSTIIAGVIGGSAPFNNLTVYEGASGSGVGGTPVFGPVASINSSLIGEVITASAPDLCLIFVINSFAGVAITCQDGFDAALEVCSESLAGTTVTFTALDDLCLNAGVQTGLSGGSPTGGVYSGSGVTDDGNGSTYSFDPAAAGVGTHTITYTNGGSATDDVEVFAVPTVTFTTLADLCIDAGVQTGLGSGTTPTGGVYSGPGVTDDGNGSTYTFDPAAAGLGVHTITYTEPSTCMSSGSDMVEVLVACGCPPPFTSSYFHCSSAPESNLVIFEICPSVGMAAKATISAGVNLGGFGNSLSVYEGSSGSGTSGTLVTGSLSGDLSGTVIAGNGANNCLIFVNTVPALGCNVGNGTAIQVCGEDIPSSITFTALADLCIDAGVQTGLGGGSPTGGVYSGPGVTDDGNGTSYSFDPAAAGAGIHTLTYTESNSSAMDDVEVFALGTAGCLSFIALDDLCIDAGVQTNLTGGLPTGGVYSGTGVTDDGNGMTYSFDPAAAGVGTHTITYTSGGFTGTDDVEVFALPLVTLEITTNSQLCLTAGVTLYSFTATPTGGTFSGAGVTNLGDGINFTFDPAIAGVGTHPVTYTFTDGNGCTGMATDNIQVFVPTVNFTAPADLCINSGVQVGLGGGTPTASTGMEIGVYSGTGVTDDGNGMTYSFDPATAGVGIHTLTYTFTNDDGCTNSASDDVAVNALPTAAFTAPADLCVNAGVQVGLGGGTPTGGVYSGAGVTDDGDGLTYSFDPAAAGVGVHTLTYTVGAAGCFDSATDDVEVYALPTVTLNTLTDQCLDAGVQIGMAGGSPSGGVYSGSGVTDNANGMNFNFDPALAGVGVHTLTYTFTDGNGCTGTGTDMVEVFALPTVTFTAIGDACVTSSPTTYNGFGKPIGGTYSGSGVTDNGNGVDFFFNPAAAGVGVHTLTYTFTDGNGCANSASQVVQIFAIPTAAFTATADLCLNAGVQSGLGGGTPTGGVYSGAGVTDDGDGLTFSFDPAAAGVGTHSITYTVGVSGCSDSASDDVEVFALPTVTFNISSAQDTFCIDAGVQIIPNGSPTGGVYSGPGVTDNGNGMDFSFDPASAGLGLHIITYTFTDANGCTEDDSDFISVQPLPTVNFTAPADLCINAGVQAGLGGGTPANGSCTGPWCDHEEGTYSGPGVTDNGNGMDYDFDPAAAGVGVHTITYTYTSGPGCISSATDDVEVFALPIAAFTAPANICLDAGVQAGLGGGTPTGGVYNGSGVTDNGDGMTYDFDPAAAGVGTHTITYDFTDTNGCSGSASDVVEVFALPLVTFNIPAVQDTFCIDSPTEFINGGSPVGGVYSGPGVTDSGNGMTFIFDPAAAGLGLHIFTYTFTDANGCSEDDTDFISVQPLPTVNFTAPADLCLDAGVQVGLGGGTPPQGTQTSNGVDMGVYSGTGVTDDGNGMTYSFDPAIAGVGIHTITYTYTSNITTSYNGGQAGCSNSASDNIEVFALPIVSFTAPVLDVCVADLTEMGLGGGTPTGGVYSGLGVTDDGNGMTFSFDPTASAPAGGNIPVTYTFTDANGCNNSASGDIFVNPICCDPPTITCPPDNFGLPVGCNPTVPAGASTFNITGGTTPDPALPTVTDGCDPMVLTFIDAMADVGCMRTVTRTYRITDDNGDFDECDQVFTFTVDTDPPVLSAMPASTTVECDAVPDVPNITATDNCPTIAPVLFINEIHYDNAGGDVGEFLEIAGSAGIDLSNYEVYAYEAFDGNFDAQVALSGIIPNEGAGFGAVAFTRTELPTGFFENGPADAIALVEIATGDVIKFISYEGTATANNGPAAGLTSTNIGTEPSNTPIGQSLQLIGMNGCPSSDFTWTGPITASPGLINAGQSFDLNACPQVNDVPVLFMENITPGACPQEQTITRTWSATDNCGNPTTHIQIITVEDNTAPVFCNAPMNITVNCGEVPAAELVTATDNCDFSGMANPVWINEFHYDNTGTDAGEFIEIAGVAGTDLTGYQLVTYNGSNGLVDDTYDLSGIIDNETCNRGALSFLTPGLQNGSPDGFTLIAPDGTVLEFLSYEGSFTANNGSASGMTSTDVGVSESGTTPVGSSLQLINLGASGPDFSWAVSAAGSPGSLNTDQEITGNLVGILTEDDNTTFCDGGTITRTWNVEDACGNMATAHVQTITVNPPVAPTLTPPTFPTSISCEAAAAFVALPATFTNGIIGTCNISGSIPAIVNNAFDACGGIITITYDDVDQCGNPLMAGPFTINVEPAPVPTISIPAYASPISCVNAENYVPPVATYTNGLSGACNISGTIQAGVDNTWDACGGTLVLHYFTIDQCGNQIALAPIIIDVQAAPLPTITPPTLPTNIACADAETYMPPLATYDNGLQGACNLSGTTGVAVNRFFDACGGILQIIYLGEDACGRSLTKNTIVITVDPAPAPTINLPTYPSELTCSEAHDLSGIYATYNNGLQGDCEISGLIGAEFIKDVTAGDGGTVTVIYSGEDVCGNVISAPPIIIPVLPASLPTIQLPDDPATIYCWDANNFTPGIATFSNGENGFCENSGELDLTTLDHFWNNCDGGYIILQYSGFDNVGNFLQTDLFKIFVMPDTWAPQGVCLDLNVTLDDIKDIPSPDELADYQNQIASNYFETCGNVNVNLISDSGVPECGLDGTFERVYEFEITDDCGNVAGICAVTFSGNCNPLYCTLSQDFYSSPNESFAGLTSFEMIDLLIGSGANPIVIGTQACGFTLDDAACIQVGLSGQGQSISLPNDYQLNCGNPISNNLINQIITTTLNVQYNATLNNGGIDFGNFQLDAACMYIPQSISTGLPANATVNDLINYANNFIGCHCSSTCGAYDNVMAELTGIFLGLNSRFNKCHVPGPCFLDGNQNPGDSLTLEITLEKEVSDLNEETTAVDEIFEINDSKIKLYPNPANDILNLKFNDDQLIGKSGVVEIFNVQGIKVGEKVFDSLDKEVLQLDTNELSSGMYWLSIKMEGIDLVTKKFLIANR